MGNVLIFGLFSARQFNAPKTPLAPRVKFVQKRSVKLLHSLLHSLKLTLVGQSPHGTPNLVAIEDGFGQVGRRIHLHRFVHHTTGGKGIQLQGIVQVQIGECVCLQMHNEIGRHK
jgi:hypothetical protein